MTPKRRVRACVFDAYGTLFDFATPVSACRDVLGDRVSALTALWRDKQLQYTWLRGLQGRHADFERVTADALDYSLDALAINEPGLKDRLLRLYRTLDCFDEVPAMLGSLKAEGMKTAILSNGTPAMLSDAVNGAGLTGLLDFVLSVEDVGVFKPHPAVYALAVDRLGVPADEILFLSSNAWDAHAAAAFGMRVIWCNRYGQRPERLPGVPDHEIQTLAPLPDLVAYSG